MPSPLDLVKMFQVSKMNVYVSGEVMPYLMSIKVPAIVTPTEEFNNTSLGGKVSIGDAARREVDGTGEVTIESVSPVAYAKFADSSIIHTLTISLAMNALNPQLGQMLPYPCKYTIGAQFVRVEDGEIKPSGKRDIKAQFNMLAYKCTLNAVDVIDFDFVNGTFATSAGDLLSSINALL